MVAQVSITGSASSSAGSAQCSASAGSFTDLLQAMVQSDASAMTSSASAASPQAGVAAHSDAGCDSASSQHRSGASQVPDSESESQQVGNTHTTTTADAKSIRETSSDDTNQTEAPVTEEKKDDEDPEQAMNLLVASVAPSVVPAPATVDLDPKSPVDTTPALNVEAAAAPVTGKAIPPEIPDLAVSADATTSETVAVPLADQGAETDEDSFASALQSATRSDGDATAGVDESGSAEVSGGEESSSSDSDAAAVRTAVEQKPAASGNEQSVPDQNMAPTAPQTTSESQTGAAVAAQVSNQSPAANSDSGDAVREVGQNAEPAQSARSAKERLSSKDDASFRRIEEAESEQDSAGKITESSVSSPDAIAGAQSQTGKGSDSASRNDVPLQPAAAEAHASKGSDTRSGQAGSSYLENAAFTANAPVHTPDQSAWMSSVRLMERISQSEMRLGIQSDLGDIAVRTAMNRDQFSAEISVQHAGLRDAIAAEIPSLQARLVEQHIPLGNVAVTADAGSFSNGYQQSSQDGRPAPYVSSSLNASENSTNEHEPVSPVEVLGRGTGLDIRI